MNTQCGRTLARRSLPRDRLEALGVFNTSLDANYGVLLRSLPLELGAELEFWHTVGAGGE